MLRLGGDEHRSSKVKDLSHTGLLVTRGCTRTSWQGSRVQGKEQRALLSRAELIEAKRTVKMGYIPR